MLSGLHNSEHKNSAPESSKNTASQSDSANSYSSWKETPDDVVTAGSKQWMSHKERAQLVRNRSYSPVKPSETQNCD